MLLTEKQLKKIIKEESEQVLMEFGVLDKLKDFIKNAPEETAKLGGKIKNQIMSFPELYPIFMKVISREKLLDADKKALSDALADIFKGSAFAATLVGGAGGLAFVAPIATVLMLALEEMGVDWRPSAFAKGVDGDGAPEHVGMTTDMDAGRLAYAKG